MTTNGQLSATSTRLEAGRGEAGRWLVQSSVDEQRALNLKTAVAGLKMAHLPKIALAF
jgi:hypothetical protein